MNLEDIRYFRDHLYELGGSGPAPIVLVNSAPKSASQFMHSVIGSALSCESDEDHLSLRPVEPGVYSHRIDPLSAIVCRMSGRPSVTHTHLAADTLVESMLRKFDVRTIIMTRNLFDAVVSLTHDYARQWAANHGHGFFRQMQGTIHQPTIDWFMQACDSERYDFVIDTIVPWFFEFLTSWSAVRRRGDNGYLFIYFDEVTADETGTLVKALKFVGIEADTNYASQLAESAKSRLDRSGFNLGRSGQGRESLSSAQIDRILAIARYFKPDSWVANHLV